MHFTHRGMYRAAVFIDDPDRGINLALISASLRRQCGQLQDYVLMGNHIHPLVSAPVDEASNEAKQVPTL